MADGIHVEVFRNQPLEEFTKNLAGPSCRAGAGSAAAASAALACAMLCRAAGVISDSVAEPDGQLDWIVRNSEILRNYMVKLIDEDVKCHGPLRRALKEGEPRRIEAARQTAVSICIELVNMMGKCLDMVESMLQQAEGEALSFLLESADLAYGASRAAGRHILYMASLSPDETYRYVIRRENELTMEEQSAVYERILQTSQVR